MKNVPMRTCVGCRQIVPQGDLVRVVVDTDGETAVLDEARRRHGRGAWVHRAPACLQGAVRGGLARSFRRKIKPSDPLRPAKVGDPPAVETALATATEKS